MAPENLLKFYEPTGDVEKDQELTQSSNANLVNGVAYIAVKGSNQSYLLSAGTDAASDCHQRGRD